MVTAAGEGGAPFLSKRLYKTMTTSATAMTAVDEGPSSGLDRAIFSSLHYLAFHALILLPESTKLVCSLNI